MKKVIIYGVRNVEMRRNISYFMDDEYEIIGCTDTNCDSDVLDGGTFIKFEDLPQQEFDFILLASFPEPTLETMRNRLLEKGIPAEKIVKPTMFLQQNAEKRQTDLIANADREYHGAEGLIFGLSYSLWGIRKKKLCIPFYDCSWHGLDLYYNYHIFNYIRRGRFGAPALLVFPYYYFNYDMSRSLYQYRMGHTFAVWRLDDWHNCALQEGTNDYIANYRMFGEKVSAFYHSHYVEMHRREIYQGEAHTVRLDPIWFSRYEDTILENKAILRSFLKELLESNIQPVIVVPPLFLDGIDRPSLSAFQRKQEEFYRSLYEIEQDVGKQLVADYADIFAGQREKFYDLTHLNSSGADEFTECINRVLLGNGIYMDICRQ